MAEIYYRPSGNWREGASIGTIYILRTEDINRIGCCPYAKKAKEGDYLLCTEHSGDCFYDYSLLMKTKNGWRLNRKENIGAYVFDGSNQIKLSKRNFYLLMAGETINELS